MGTLGIPDAGVLGLNIRENNRPQKRWRKSQKKIEKNQKNIVKLFSLNSKSDDILYVSPKNIIPSIQGTPSTSPIPVTSKKLIKSQLLQLLKTKNYLKKECAFF